MTRLTIDGLFSKARRFHAESEYRIIWSAASVDSTGYLNIKYPEAIALCERVALDPIGPKAGQ